MEIFVLIYWELLFLRRRFWNFFFWHLKALNCHSIECQKKCLVSWFFRVSSKNLSIIFMSHSDSDNLWPKKHKNSFADHWINFHDMNTQHGVLLTHKCVIPAQKISILQMNTIFSSTVTDPTKKIFIFG